MVYWKLVEPLKLAAGWNVTPVAEPLIATVPFADGPAAVIVNASPSGSPSFPSTSIAVGSESSGIVALSLAATGAWLIAVTVTWTVAMAGRGPSVIVYVKLVTPLKPGVGWNVSPEPSPATTTVPCSGCDTDAILSVSPSTSVSLPST